MRRCKNLLGTFIEMKVGTLLPGEKEFTAEQIKLYQYVINIAFNEIQKVQDLMSFHNPCSDLSRINRMVYEGIKEPIEIHPWTYELIVKAKEIYTQTNGAFDCGIAYQLIKWGILPNIYPININRKLHSSSLSEVELLPVRRLRIKKGVCLDFGGIAKGYAVDRAIEVIRSCGISQAVVNAGGDIRILGQHPEKISLRECMDTSSYLSLGELSDGAIATSSTCFGRKIQGRKKYSHLVDPKTGEPINQQLSYSVIAPTCLVADALTKALAVDKNIHAQYFNWYGAQPIIVE